MNKEEKKALKVINARTRRLLDELEIEKEDMSDEPKIAYLMQEIRANKIILNLIEKLQKENEELNNRCRNLDKEAQAYLEELAGDNTLTRRTIKQLQEENEELKALDLRNSIPIQKVKDIIEKLKEKIENLPAEIYPIIEDDLQIKIEVLEELLESEE